MLADSLTTDSADPADPLRAALLHGEHQLAPEATVLEQRRQQRAVRAQRAKCDPQHESK